MAAALVLTLQGCGRAANATDAASAAPRIAAATDIEAGRYLVKIGGCNDCHTPGFSETNGATPEADWLTGAPVGAAGPWGVSYPVNLRLALSTMDEDEFLDLAHAGEGRPPMPWPSLKAMSDGDLRAIYRYIRWLGPKGVPAPAPLAPGEKPAGPTITFVPSMPS
ncbi:MAG: cytochrome C [Alphaproteobacteria bacterium]|nr:cytochrome C [Alphaproteobacteria bacterium]